MTIYFYLYIIVLLFEQKIFKEKIMKGSIVAIIFIIVNVVAISIFMIVTTTSIKKSILTEEKLSREYLNNI